MIVTIRGKLILLGLVWGGLTLTLAYTAQRQFRSYQKLRAQVQYSHWFNQELSDNRAFNPDSITQFQEIRAKVTPVRRMQELSNLIQSMNEQHGRYSRERLTVFLKNEREFRRVSESQLEYLENHMYYLIRLMLICQIIGFLTFTYLARAAILSPLRSLAQKMEDFLNDRYTYQFTVPTADEIGNMQATFNALAQRVLVNMEQLKSLDQAKSDFLSIASHELRTPLTSIKGSLSLIRSGVVGNINEMAENLLKIAEVETDRLIRLINDILDLAKIEARKVSLQPAWHSLNQLLQTSLKSLDGLAQQAHVHLEIAPMPAIEVHMDRDRIHQVLTNLLSNAIKFSPQGKAVSIHCAINGDNQLIVEVCDQGRGIDPKDQELIFQKFRQATNANNPLVKGTGLGLAIAKALVDQHGGEIGVRSVPGEGSTFYFTLPEWRNGRDNSTEVAA